MKNILCLHTKNYYDDEFGYLVGTYKIDSLHFDKLEFTQENANKVIERFVPTELDRENYRLINICEITILVNHKDPRLNDPNVISFKYVRNNE